jgi:adenosylcobinamide-GDP ribazoletransferase
MPGPATMFASGVAAHVMSRAIAVGLMASVPLAQHTGLGADYGRSTTTTRGVVAMASGIAITALAVGWWVGPLLGATLVAAVGIGALAKHKIDGISGDVLGACQQVAECACLVVLSGLATHHSLWWS